ncbi:MAG: HlyD family efflux transporter periplasmic adaptor subunit [Flavobacteriales bacterium]|nr:HlyD family efflux transporter periplasmic adaptor subunit [Flavobacteriales bacterium]
MKKTYFYASVLLALIVFSCSSNKENYDASGTFEATEVIVSSEVAGRIEQMNATEGTRLKKGDTSCVIDTVQLHLKKMQLKASLEAIRSARADVSAQIAALKEQIAHNNNEIERTSRLIKGGAANQKQLDDLSSNAKVLEKQLKAQLSTLDKTNASSDASAQSMEYQILQIEDQLRKSSISNPVSGIVLAKYAEEGELTTIGRSMYKIADTDTLFLRAYATAAQTTQIKIGSSATVYADFGDEDKKEYSGVVTWVSEKGEFTPKGIKTRDERASTVYAVKIKVVNTDGLLKIGQWGDVSFSTIEK